MNRVAVINIVGLTEALIGDATPRISEFCRNGALARISPAFPAVTCAAQSNYLTGKLPTEHGIVGNGWFNRDLAEVHFWKQSNRLVQGRKIWDALSPGRGEVPFRAANCFWWFNMYSTVDYSITPRPIYRADGGKIFDVYSWPYSIREEIKRDLGDFPFFGFWGPGAGVKTPQGSADCATRWIAESAKWIEGKYSPGLNLIYLPHLDYNLQRHGPFVAGSRQINPVIIPDLNAIDSIVGDLIDFFRSREIRILLLSEYGITNVNTPIHLNRIFRRHGWLTIKDELGLEILDAGASRVFAVSDHQVAHIYVNDRALERSVRDTLEKTAGIEKLLGDPDKVAAGIDHPRAGDLIAVAAENAWFTYYYWENDARAPDFARTVDIHRKPGYDPAELFIDPNISMPQLKIARRLLQKKLGFRMLMDVVPLDASLVNGSHGRRPSNQGDWPIIAAQEPAFLNTQQIESTDVYNVLLRQFT
jgi:predicted AlkP superfamily pyrophosphatase or phosphodiesterase